MANEEKSNQQEVKQLSYDELRKAASELSMQLQRMSQQFNLERQKHQKETQELQMFNMFKRLDFLFKVVENAPMFPAEFVENKDILNILGRMDVDFAQGYHIGIPAPVENFFPDKAE